MIEPQYNCDICAMDGEEEILGVAEYKAGDGQRYIVCGKHLEDVKKSGLKYIDL